MRGAKRAREPQAGSRQPDALEFAARFPIQDRLISEVRNRHALVLFERQIGDERPVRYDDGLASFELAQRLRELRIILQRDHIIDKRKRAVQALGVAIGDRERLKAFVASAFENL